MPNNKNKNKTNKNFANASSSLFISSPTTSYSRQNLLSTNSNKSNEEQQQQNQQQQHQHQVYLQQRLMDQLDAAGPASHYRAQQQQHLQQQQTHRRATATTLPATAALTTSNLQQLQRQQQQQEEAVQQQQATQTQSQLQPQPQLYRTLGVGSNSNSCNNLNFERNENENKYLRTMQRSHINRYQQQQQQQQQQNLGLTNSLYSNHNKLYQSSAWLPAAAPTAPTAPGTNCADTSTDADNVELDAYDSYNIIDSDLAAPYAHLSSNMGVNASNMLRNMNVNFGNSPHYQRNKLLTKPNCRGAEAMEQHNPNRALQQEQQQQQQQQQHQHHQRMLTQHQLALRAQQRLDHSTLLPLRNTVAFAQARYLDLLPATVSEAVATAETQLRNRERVDMLLRTVSANDDDDDVIAALSTSRNMGGAYIPSHANDLHLMDSNEIGNNTPNIENEDADMEADGDGDGDGDIEAELNADMDVGNDDEDDDTTSEEIKRNLLVNALKNDKFTTKFYESIKEDVFRRLERMLLEKEATENNYRLADEQICNGLAAANDAAAAVNAVDGCANVLGASALLRDPTRKFNLNARMGNQQQQQRMQQYKQQQEQQQQQQQQQNVVPYQPANFGVSVRTAAGNSFENKPATNDNPDAEDDQHALPVAGAAQAYANNRQANEMKDNAEEDEYAANNADTESNKADNEDAAAAAAAEAACADANTDRMQTESEQPEEDDGRYSNNNNNNNNDATINVTAESIMPAQNGWTDSNAVANWRQNIFNHATPNSATASASNISKKLKNQAEPACNSGAGGDAQSSIAGNNNTAANNVHLSYYSELIAYIITRIRNQTHINTQINDTVLVEIAKLTACAVQKFAPTLVNYKSLSIASPTHISPKKFYMKIKKLAAPRQRDEFLQWYQNYLENLFPGARLEAEKRRADELRNGSASAGGAAASGVELELPHKCDKLENQQQRHTQQQQQQQKQVRQQQPPTTSESSTKDHNNDEDLAEADQNSANSSSNSSNILLLQQSTREKEFENNENPDGDEIVIEVSNEASSMRAAPTGVYDGGLISLSAAGAAAAAAITDEAIFAAVQQQQQQHNSLHFNTEAVTGVPLALEPDDPIT